ncbi:MAG: GAF domain-containing protein [Fimbriimonadaceae bacterium]|nr:GAF domain-containing protein [Fimbriimonadaceae bacterium]
MATDKAIHIDAYECARKLLELTSSAQSEDALLAEIAHILVRECGVEDVHIFISDKGALVLRASTSAPEFNYRTRLGPDVGLVGQAATTREPIFIPADAASHPKNVRVPGFDNLPFEACGVVPMLSGPDLRGICVLSTGSEWNLTSANQREVCKAVEAATLAHKTFRHLYHLRTARSRIGAVTEVTKTIADSPYIEEILQLLVSMTAKQFNYRVCTVRLLDEDRGELVLRATQSQAKAYQSKRAIRLGESIAGKAIEKNHPIIVLDVQNDPDYIGHDLAVEQGLVSMICLPLVIHDNAVGVISCYTSEMRNFLPDEIAALETIAKHAAMSIENAKLQVRSTLMQEMHHRVKNNLQQVASLLRLQMRHGQYKSLEEALSDSLTRILAISAVHDLLSREDLDHVGMYTLANTLMQHQRESFSIPEKRITFLVRGDEVHLNTIQATQVALILNELIQNAVEHGFKDADEGEIHVTVEQRDEEMCLWVSNSGVPIPEDFDMNKAKNLGLQIVESLVRGLGGKWRLANVLGWTVAEVKFQVRGGE